MSPNQRKDAKPVIGIWIENLMDRVRVGESLKKADYKYENLPNPEACLQFVNDSQSLIIVDLQNKGIEEFAKGLPNDVSYFKRVICYFPHQQIDLKRNAQKCGIEHIFPRSMFFRDTSGLLQRVTVDIWGEEGDSKIGDQL